MEGFARLGLERRAATRCRGVEDEEGDGEERKARVRVLMGDYLEER